MPYPFRPAVRYTAFLAHLESLGVEIKKAELQVVSPDGELLNMRYLSRNDGIGIHYCPLTFADETDEVQFDVMRSVCKALRLDPVLMQLDLG